MAYLGNSPQQNIRQRYYYNATAGQTVFSGNDITGINLKYQDGKYLDVYVNGALLQNEEDYTAVDKSSVVLSSGAQANDIIEIIAYGVFSVADTVSSSLGGTFSNNIVVDGTLSVSGNVGIGTASPTSNLHVAGTANITNTLIVAGNPVTPVTGFKNRIINGNFDFWQRGTSVTGVADSQYLADRWISRRIGTTANVSQQAFTLGQTDVPGEPTYFHRSVVTSVAGAGNRFVTVQYIESVRTFAGQTATLSFWAKADASKNIAVEFLQEFGTGGSPSGLIGSIGVTTCALTTAWKKFTVTVNVPSISGKTLGSDNNDKLWVLFWFDAGSNFNSRTNSLGQQSGTFDIAQVQLEAGPVDTPFEQRPLGQELALCQRYYEVVKARYQIDLGSNIAFHFIGWMPYLVQKRSLPSITLPANHDSITYSVDRNDIRGIGLLATYSSAQRYISIDITFSRSVLVDAEL